MVAELDGKLERFTAGGDWPAEARPAGPLGGPAEEAIAALMALGEHRQGAETRVRMALAREKEGATVESLIASALGG